MKPVKRLSKRQIEREIAARAKWQPAIDADIAERAAEMERRRALLVNTVQNTLQRTMVMRWSPARGVYYSEM